MARHHSDSGDYSSNDEVKKYIKPMDRLCMALAYKLGRDDSIPVETAATPQSIQELTQECFVGASQ